MSTMLSLFCYVLGDGPNNIFRVEIDSSKSIGTLKDIIKAKKSPTFNDVPASKLCLWKASIAVDDIANGIDGNKFEDTRSLLLTSKLSTVFSGPLLDEHVHVVIRPKGSFTDDIDFYRKVFRCFWRRRGLQTYIHERDGFKYLDLRPLELQFDGKHARILIRQDYSRLISEVLGVYGLYLNQPPPLKPGGVVVTGQPGIGKTLFLQWLLLERLLDGQPTILRTREGYAYFSANGFIRISESALPLFPVPSIQEIWLLADPLFGGGGPPQTGLFTIFTTPPSEDLYKEWSKQNLAESFIMSPWTWEELNFVGSSLYDKGSIDLKKLETAFTLYGPTARNPLAFAGGTTALIKLESAIDQAISSVDCSTLHQLANQQAPPDVASKILCMFADDMGLPIFKIASVHILDKLYESLLSRERAELVRWFRGFTYIPKTGTAVGWIWEGHCHRTLPTLSSLAITCLDDGGRKTLHLVPSRRVDFKVLKEIPEEPSPGYYAPVTSNHTTFDAFSVTDDNRVVLMQFTVSSNHPESKGEGWDALADVLSNNFKPVRGCSWLFIWIVPKGKEHDITAKTSTEGHWKAWQKQGKMKQYVATLEI